MYTEEPVRVEKVGPRSAVRAHAMVRKDVFVDYASVTARLSDAHADSRRLRAELAELVDGVKDVGDRAGWLTRGSKQRRIRRALARYEASAEKLRDGQRLLDEATELLGGYVSTITDALPADPLSVARHLLSEQAATATTAPCQDTDGADAPSV